MKNLVKDYFRFSRKDRLGGLVVLLLLGTVYLIPLLLPSRNAGIAIVPNSLLSDALDTLEAAERRGYPYSTEDRTGPRDHFEPRGDFNSGKAELFVFDPNTLPAEGWQRLGLSGRTANTIVKYRNKGGKFYQAEDVKKIWGLPKGFYERVAPFIRTGGEERRRDRTTYPAKQYEDRRAPAGIQNINTADTSAFIALPGIGQKLAARIVAFRDKLGGFTSVEQVKETYGLSDSTFQIIRPYLKVDEAGIKKLNLNSCTRDELKTHPYFKWNLANAIISYRDQHGPFKTVQELKKIMLIDEATYEKIKGYVAVD
ncbi:MAG TPA: helix-hairpin-helix domain-containing protein [Flavisolibacter sp.]